MCIHVCYTFPVLIEESSKQIKSNALGSKNINKRVVVHMFGRRPGLNISYGP